MTVDVITAYDVGLPARRRAIRDEYHDVLFAKIARARSAEKPALPVPGAAPSGPAAAVSDEAFARVRQAAEERVGATPAPTYRSPPGVGDEAAEAILAAFGAFRPGTPNNTPPAGPAPPNGDAAVAAILEAFRVLEPAKGETERDTLPHNDADMDAVAAILAAMPPERRK